MIMRINMRFNLDRKEDKRAWDVVQKVAESENCSVNKAIISLINKNMYKNINEFTEKVVTAIKGEFSMLEVTSTSKKTETEENTDIIFDFLDNF